MLRCFAFLYHTLQGLWPASVPLAVRSPYLSSWEAMTNGSHPPNNWPTTWQDPSSAQILGWQGYIRVDGTTYSFLGAFPDNELIMNISAMTITPTRTIWSLAAGPMIVNVTFFSPIEPGDWVRQSIPFSYLYVEAASVDGNQHSVQVYSDISAEWSSGNRSERVQWQTVADSNSVYHKTTLGTQTQLDETKQQAEWGTTFFGMRLSSLVTYKVGSDKDCRDQFHNNGKLDLGEDSDFRGIADNFPVYAVSVDLGDISTTGNNPVVWAIGYTRDPALSYADLDGATQSRSLYYNANFTDVGTVVNEFLNDFGPAKARADKLDAKILGDAGAMSSDYADIVSLAARQVYGATELTIAKGSDGSWNTSDVMMFMKNIGDVNMNRVNAVETLYSAFPLFMYIDPKLGGPLLEPLLRFQNSSKYTNAFAAQDVGSSYPVAIASTSVHEEGIEQSANMLIMTYAYARTTGDGSLANRYYGLLKNWTDYLVVNTLHPRNQASPDTQYTTNQTNLAIKGIIAIKAMSDLSSALGQFSDAQQYSVRPLMFVRGSAQADVEQTNATQLVQQWQAQALSSDKTHLLATYGNQDTSTIAYNLFADKWLGTNLVDQSVYEAQSTFYSSQLSNARNQYGIPTDSSDISHAKSTYNLFAAAAINDTGVRNSIISKVRARASLNLTSASGVFPTEYDAFAGNTTSGGASPAQGAVFAPLALKYASFRSSVSDARLIVIASVGRSVPAVQITVAAADHGAVSQKKANAGAIAGGVVGGLILLGLIVAGGFFFWRRRRGLQGPSKLDKIERGGSGNLLEPFDGRDTSEYRATPDLGTWRSASSMGMSASASVVVPPSDSSYSSHNTETINTFPLPAAPEPAFTNLSAKELARLRADVNAPPVNRASADWTFDYEAPSPSVYVPPSSKELARLRAMNLAAAAAGRPRFTDPFQAGPSLVQSTMGSHSPSNSNVSHVSSLGVAAASIARAGSGSGSGSGSSSGVRSERPSVVGSQLTQEDAASALRTEVEVLRREMQQIRAERLEPPPSYFEDLQGGR
ncbi:hypothetical protein EVG20_g3433 [Dentipellis fragilis]|uniref:DUF1793-domain-containing protein n=1 Tax=Dentipellis fragilis TaxID=205917 RepID=A0A4Y9Z4J6_9AGAM|nr:hypothetical protein EVG20_g3433 [Dentipellis fragilis]